MRRFTTLIAVCLLLPAQSNRLAREKSPYLRQHATNPVDWHPWGEEAFAKARRLNRPIFLSIGYSTCHWCHVMERESFANDEVARQLNAGFIAIKVDREERPDIDRIYMAFAAGTTGAGGWPLSVWLAPDGRPFHAGAYYPRDVFLQTLARISGLWQSVREALIASSRELSAEIARINTPPAPEGAIGNDALDMATQAFTKIFDPVNGGFGPAPKFPRPAVLSYLLAHQGRQMVYQTLNAMASGGIQDAIDGGFHRYTTDAAWRQPHFEKMLSDQALLAQVYLDAYLISSNHQYRAIVRSTLDFILKHMQSQDGAFHTALDADENYYKLPKELRTIPPRRDDKIMANWNGLAISALARAGASLGDIRYTNAATRAANALLRTHFKSGKLLHHAAVPAFLEDYVFLVRGLVDLYEASFDPAHLQTALRLTARQLTLFRNDATGAFFASMNNDRFLWTRMEDGYDGAEPSANAIAAMNLFRLADYTNRPDLRARGEAVLRAFASRIVKDPSAYPAMLSAYAFHSAPRRQIVIAGEPGSPLDSLVQTVHTRFLPHKILLVISNDRQRKILAGYIFQVRSMRAIRGKPAAYVCENYVCKLPVTTPAGLANLLD